MKSFTILLATALLVGSLSAAVPQTIVYQGRLTDNGAPVPDGLYLIQFRIYDAPAAGTTLWDNGYRTVLVTDGLFEYRLGDSTTLPHKLFSDTGRWLGMKVGANPEMSPRIPLGSYAYAYHALRADTAQCALQVAGDPYVNEVGDSMTGALTFAGTGNEMLAQLAPSPGARTADIYLYDRDVTTMPTAALYGDSYGDMALRDLLGNRTADVNAGTGTGAWLQLNNPGAGRTIGFNTQNAGDISVEFPDNAINEVELLNEPGLAFSYRYMNPLSASTVARTIDSVQITAPTSGYVYLAATGNVITNHTSGEPAEDLRLSLSSIRDSIDYFHYQGWGVASSMPSANYRCPISITRVEAIPKGASKFYFTARAATDNSNLSRIHLTALFFPTAYGTVDTPKSLGQAEAAPEIYDARPIIEAERAAQLEQQRLDTDARLKNAQRGQYED